MICWNNKLCTLAVLLVLFGCITCISGNYRRPTSVGLMCCKKVSKVPIPHNKNLTGYMHQNELFPCVKAVVFFTDKAKYCSNPSARWIQKRLKGLPEFKDINGTIKKSKE